ncbi:MAG: UDP-N-acetylmuramate--L-alanine ligase [Anaerofustis stercorihominis]|nr:UDP-N-acetylmuramate--L-alanine ligase [Anaerofustis stercorihominis]
MKQNRLDNIKKIFFVGIGGTSMSGLALISLTKGFEVSGVDMRPCSYTEKLEKYGVKVYIGHDANNVPEDTDLLVYSAAIKETNPERMRAKELGIPEMERSVFLGCLSDFYPATIAISGTHGKTTTSSLSSLLLYYADMDPSVSIGGTLELLGGNYRCGEGDYFVIEACEFVDSFLHTKHKIGTILNIEEDHLDYFTGGIDHIRSSFEKFAKIIPDDGLLIANGDDEQVRKILPNLTCNIATFGFGEGNDWRALNISYDALGKPTFDAYKGEEYYGTFSLNIPGAHNVSNSLSVIILADHLGIDKEVIHKTFAAFTGANRRFQLAGEERGIKVFEDYAHHPTELRVTIEACKNYEHNKLWVVFQPHTYSRTFFLFDEFVAAVKDADEVIFNDIYSDREANDWNIYSEDLAKAATERYGASARVISKFEDIVKFISDNAEEGDIVLVAGSQSINKVAYDLVEYLKNNK